MRFPFFFMLCMTMLLAVSAAASPFDLGPASRNLVLVPGYHHADLTLPIQPAGGGFDYSQVQVSSNAAWVTPQVDAAGQKVILKFTTAALATGSHSATLTATHGADIFAVTLSAASTALNVFKLLDDPHRSRMYGIQLNGILAGSLLVIDPLTATPVSSITVGKRPTGMAISDDGSELFVINCVDKTISVIDLQTLAVSATITLPVFGNWGQSTTTANVGVGPGDVLYYTDGSWGPVLHVYNRSSQQVLQSLTATVSGYGFGDFALNASKTHLFGWVQYGWSAGNAGSHLWRYAVSGTGTLTAMENSSAAFQLNRDPLETPVLVANDEEKVFVKEVVVDATAISSISRSYATDVYSISPGGEIAVTNNAIYKNFTGSKLLDLPVTTSIHGITSDYARLVIFNPVSSELETMDLFALIGAEAMGRVPHPASGGSVLQPASLSWAGQPGANRYEVFFGSTFAAVNAATTASSEYLGSTLAPTFPAPDALMPGATYYWRVDTVLNSHTSTGSVHSFTVSPIIASASKVETSTVQSHADHRIKVQLSSAAPGLSWSVSADQPWVTFVRSTGTTPAELEICLDAGNLDVGMHSALLTVTGATGTLFTLPVHLRVEPLKLTHLKSDPLSSITYAISEDTATTGAKAYLLEVDAATESILRVVPAGTSVTDLAIHQADNRIYLPNWKIGSLLAFNKTTLALERTYPFSPFQGTGSGNNDVYRVAAGKAGRLVVEEEDQHIDINVFDTVNGTKKGGIRLSEGGGAFEPSGRYYYHGESNSSGAKIHKLDVTGDVMTSVSSIRVSSYSYYGSRVVVGTEDGQSIFWNGSLFNADLVEQWSIADQIYSTSADGRLAFGEKKIYDTSARQQVLTMPVSTRVSAYNNTTKKLMVQNGTQLRYYPLDFPLTLRSPVLSLGSGVTTTTLPVKWTKDSMGLATVLEYRAVGAADWIPRSQHIALDSFTLTGLQPGTEYEIRLQATSPSLTAVWSNTVVARTLDIPPPTVTITDSSGYSTTLFLYFRTTLNPTSIIVERADLQDGPWTVIDTLPGTATSYGDISARTDVAYYYRLQAIRDSFFSYSPVESAILPGPNIFLYPPSEYQGNINFLATISNYNYTYMLQRFDVGKLAWLDIMPSGTYMHSYTDTTTVPATTYTYRLKALPESKTSRVSNEVTIRTLPPSPPPTPEGFEITGIALSQIGLKWEATYSAVGYRIERRNVSETPWTLLATLDAGATAYTDSTPFPGHGYRYRVIAYNAQGDSSAANAPPVYAQELKVTMEDDFDPELDAAQWTTTSVSTSVDGGTGFNGSKALWFGHEGTRMAATRSVDASAGGFIEFSLRAGNQTSDGFEYWRNADYGEEIRLEYSFNGTDWNSYRSYDMTSVTLASWAHFRLPIPLAYGYSGPYPFKTWFFRWRQYSYHGYLSQGHWALDNVRITSASVDDLRITSPPVSKLVKVGEPASLSVRATPSTATFQWYQDGEMVPGATLATCSLASAEPAHGGSYTCEIRHGDEVLTTQPVMLGVVEMAEEGPFYTRVGESFSLGMRVHPASLEEDLTFSWRRIEEEDLAGIGTVSGELASTLTVTEATAAAESAYQCRVTYQTDLITRTLDVGPYEVRLLRRPTIQPLADVDVVSGNAVDIAIGASDPPVFIQVRDLPKGLSYDADTQRIVGSLTGNKSYTITVQANNAQGAAEPVSFQLNVVGFPAALAGTYRGVFTDRDADPAYRHGAQTAFKITPKGAASGTVMIRGKNRRFVSKNVAAAADGAWGRLEAAFDGLDGSPLRLEVDIVGGAALHEAVLLTGGEGEPQILTAGYAVRNDWTKANPAPGAGLINTALLPPELEEGLTNDTGAPRGVGFLNLKLTPQGAVTCKGRLADGQAVTGSTLMGPQGHMPVFVSLHRGTGGFGTLMTYSPSGQAGGSAWWGKDDQGPSSKDRVHKNGFIRNTLSVEGGQYQRPAANTPLFASQVDVPTPATLTLTRAGLPEPGITQVLSFTGKHQADVPRESALNPHGITLKVKAATGTFTGKFKLEDPNPLKPSATLRRTVTFQGSLIPGLERGYGYFLLPELPSAEIPRNPPMWSGRVEIVPAEVE
ncbi:fibronectin type III domain-containing protein [Prosthecobacter sp. SYSU 5D2]|uniref:fibronectin type III domain-containing protein n=1 Tax=Prosthecobacter sp. SYSU 5D2 TaxID=3134134 RepID=UPI0031FED9AF